MEKVFILLLFCVACSQSTEGVKQSFLQYQSAISQSDGDLAYSSIDQESKEHYDWLADAAKKMDRDDINSLDLMKRIQILSTRHRIPGNELSVMDGKSLFVYVVNKGWIGKETVDSLSLNRISMDGDSATASMKLKGKPVPLQSRFTREDKLWKINLIEMNSWGEKTLLKYRDELKISEEEFAALVIEKVSKKKVDMRTIYKPLNP